MSDGASLPQPPTPFPLTRARHVRLRVIMDQDSRFLYELMTAPSSGGRVRFAGATPSPEKIASSLWESVLAQFIVEGIDSGQPLGLIAVTSPNFRDGFAYISAIGSPEVQGSGLIAEGLALGFRYAFNAWPFRKIYMESTEESYRGFKSGLDRFFVEEGRLRGHFFWNGRYTDLVILAFYREVWERNASLILNTLHAGA